MVKNDAQDVVFFLRHQRLGALVVTLYYEQDHEKIEIKVILKIILNIVKHFLNISCPKKY